MLTHLLQILFFMNCTSILSDPTALCYLGNREKPALFNTGKIYNKINSIENVQKKSHVEMIFSTKNKLKLDFLAIVKNKLLNTL